MHVSGSDTTFISTRKSRGNSNIVYYMQVLHFAAKEEEPKMVSNSKFIFPNHME
jgi:hypothetical protein